MPKVTPRKPPAVWDRSPKVWKNPQGNEHLWVQLAQGPAAPQCQKGWQPSTPRCLRV